MANPLLAVRRGHGQELTSAWLEILVQVGLRSSHAPVIPMLSAAASARIGIARALAPSSAGDSDVSCLGSWTFPVQAQILNLPLELQGSLASPICLSPMTSRRWNTFCTWGYVDGAWKNCGNGFTEELNAQ